VPVKSLFNQQTIKQYIHVVSDFYANVLCACCNYLLLFYFLKCLKKLSGGMLVICLERSAKLAYGPADATAAHCLASVKSKFVLLFWDTGLSR